MKRHGGAQVNVEHVHYNVICDEGVSLRCGNTGCAAFILPDTAMVVAYDGTVFCSVQCAGAAGVPE